MEIDWQIAVTRAQASRFHFRLSHILFLHLINKLFSQMGICCERNTVKISSIFKHFIQNVSTFQTLKTQHQNSRISSTRTIPVSQLDVNRITPAAARECRQTAPFCKYSHTEKYRESCLELIGLISFVSTHLAIA